MASAAPNVLKTMLAKGQHAFATDSFKMILMQSGFSFDKDNHDAYADVSASELATANGYTAGGAAMSGIVITTDDTDDRCEITWSNVQWTASGGSITASGAIIFNDSTVNPTDDETDAIVAYIDFGGNQTATDGNTFTIANPEVRIA